MNLALIWYFLPNSLGASIAKEKGQSITIHYWDKAEASRVSNLLRLSWLKVALQYLRLWANSSEKITQHNHLEVQDDLRNGKNLISSDLEENTWILRCLKFLKFGRYWRSSFIISKAGLQSLACRWVLSWAKFQTEKPPIVWCIKISGVQWKFQLVTRLKSHDDSFPLTTSSSNLKLGFSLFLCCKFPQIYWIQFCCEFNISLTLNLEASILEVLSLIPNFNRHSDSREHKE